MYRFPNQPITIQTDSKPTNLCTEKIHLTITIFYFQAKQSLYRFSCQAIIVERVSKPINHKLYIYILQSLFRLLEHLSEFVNKIRIKSNLLTGLVIGKKETSIQNKHTKEKYLETKEKEKG